jgi:hypothetical protein
LRHSPEGDRSLKKSAVKRSRQWGDEQAENGGSWSAAASACAEEVACVLFTHPSYFLLLKKSLWMGF